MSNENRAGVIRPMPSQISSGERLLNKFKAPHENGRYYIGATLDSIDVYSNNDVNIRLGDGSVFVGRLPDNESVRFGGITVLTSGPDLGKSPYTAPAPINAPTSLQINPAEPPRGTGIVAEPPQGTGIVTPSEVMRHERKGQPLSYTELANAIQAVIIASQGGPNEKSFNTIKDGLCPMAISCELHITDQSGKMFTLMIDTGIHREAKETVSPT